MAAGSRRLPRHRVLLVLAAVVALCAPWAAPAPTPAPTAARYFGTLQTDPARAVQEHRSGLGVAELELRWDSYEPREGVHDPQYVESVRARIRTLRSAGLRIEASLGLNHPPAWLASVYPATAFVDQYGDRYTGAPNLVFSPTAREKARHYVDMVSRDLGLGQFWAIRVGVDADGEFSYPPTAGDGSHTNAYWAFDPGAQAPAGDGARPAGVPANPFPGWRPGEAAHDGRPFTAQDADTWARWYLAALAGAVNWQIDLYGARHFRGHLDVLVPGTGIRPWEYRAAVDRLLDGTVEPRWMGLGVAFQRTVPLVRPGPGCGSSPPPSSTAPALPRTTAARARTGWWTWRAPPPPRPAHGPPCGGWRPSRTAADSPSPGRARAPR